MNSFVNELSVLLSISAPNEIEDKEEYLKHKIKQEISRLYLNQRSMQRKIDELERKTLLYGI